MIDAHCHLEYMDDSVIEEARQKMTALVASTADPKHVERIMEIKRKYGNFVFLCLGFHPEVMVKYDNVQVEKYMRLIRDSRNSISAIGEVGLDYNWVTSREEQTASRKIFLKFVELSKELGLPVVVHSRNGRNEDAPNDAITDVINILIESGVKNVMMHCFSGSETNMRTALEQGWYISFATLVCKSEKHQRLAKLVPLDQMMLETDSPWLDPDSRELVNRPWKIERSAEVIATLKGTTKDAVLRVTEENAKNFFGIKV